MSTAAAAPVKKPFLSMFDTSAYMLRAVKTKNKLGEVAPLTNQCVLEVIGFLGNEFTPEERDQIAFWLNRHVLAITKPWAQIAVDIENNTKKLKREGKQWKEIHPDCTNDALLRLLDQSGARNVVLNTLLNSVKGCLVALMEAEDRLSGRTASDLPVRLQHLDRLMTNVGPAVDRIYPLIESTVTDWVCSMDHIDTSLATSFSFRFKRDRLGALYLLIANIAPEKLRNTWFDLLDPKRPNPFEDTVKATFPPTPVHSLILDYLGEGAKHIFLSGNELATRIDAGYESPQHVLKPIFSELRNLLLFLNRPQKLLREAAKFAKRLVLLVSGGPEAYERIKRGDESDLNLLQAILKKESEIRQRARELYSKNKEIMLPFRKVQQKMQVLKMRLAETKFEQAKRGAWDVKRIIHGEIFRRCEKRVMEAKGDAKKVEEATRAKNEELSVADSAYDTAIHEAWNNWIDENREAVVTYFDNIEQFESPMALYYSPTLLLLPENYVPNTDLKLTPQQYDAFVSNHPVAKVLWEDCPGLQIGHFRRLYGGEVYPIEANGKTRYAIALPTEFSEPFHWDPLHIEEDGMMNQVTNFINDFLHRVPRVDDPLINAGVLLFNRFLQLTPEDCMEFINPLWDKQILETVFDRSNTRHWHLQFYIGQYKQKHDGETPPIQLQIHELFRLWIEMLEREDGLHNKQLLNDLARPLKAGIELLFDLRRALTYPVVVGIKQDLTPARVSHFHGPFMKTFVGGLVTLVENVAVRFFELLKVPKVRPMVLLAEAVSLVNKSFVAMKTQFDLYRK